MHWEALYVTEAAQQIFQRNVEGTPPLGDQPCQDRETRTRVRFEHSTHDFFHRMTSIFYAPIFFLNLLHKYKKKKCHLLGASDRSKRARCVVP